MSSNTNTAEKPDVAALMLKIRETVREELKEHGAQNLKFNPVVQQDDVPSVPVLYSEELNYLNAHWHDWYSPQQINSHRKFFGKLVVKIKRFITNTLWNSFLRDYVERERQFQMNLIRFLNSTARYIDARDKELFWQLVQKVDNDSRGSHERTDLLIGEVDGTLRGIEKELATRIAQLHSLVDQQRAQAQSLRGEVAQIDDVARGLERTVSMLAKGASAPAAPVASASIPVRTVDYLLLENRFRGSEELIRERMSFYRDVLRAAPTGQVLDIGCGRGELLELLRADGRPARGIDLDSAMVVRSREKGLEVEHAEARAFLAGQPERSFSAILASQVVEHLKQEELENLVELAKSRLAPGGMLILETINPQSIVALASNFFRDPTHVWPVHPETLRFVLEMKGIRTVEIKMLAPYPPEAMLQPVHIADHVPAGWKGTLEQINANIARLNSLMFGHQDYCVVGYVE